MVRARIGTATILGLIDYEKQRLWLGSQRAQTISLAREKSRNGHIKRLQGTGISAGPTLHLLRRDRVATELVVWSNQVVAGISRKGRVEDK